jgi:tetratricopeptide (TPR) repeat protein
VTPRGIPQFSPDYYRPLTIATYLLDRRASAWLGAEGRGQALAFHLSVVLAHAAASALLFLLGMQLLGSATPAVAGALAAAASFAVHPVHTESVAWMAGRADVLATGFCLAALLAHRGRDTSWPRSAATGFLVACALGAKEVGAAALALLPLRDLLFFAAGGAMSRRSPSDWIRAYGGPAAALLVYLILRRASIGELVGTAPGQSGMLASLDRVGGALAAYLAKLVWPLGLNAYIDTVPTGAPAILLSLAAAGGAAAAVAASIRGRDRVPAFCLIWTFLTLAPSLSIVWKIPEAPMAERYLYLPSAGFCLLLGGLVREAWRAAPARRWAIGAAAAVVLAAATNLTVERNRVWRSDLSLWQDTSAKSVASAMPLRSLATAYQRAGDTEQARLWFERALQRRSTPLGQLIIHNNLGTIAMASRDFAAAEQHYRRALAIAPNADASFNLALAILEGGKWSADAIAAALPSLEQARTLSPYDPDVLAVLGKVQALRGERAAAVESLERSLQLGLNRVSAEGVRRLLRELRGGGDDRS